MIKAPIKSLFHPFQHLLKQELLVHWEAKNLDHRHTVHMYHSILQQKQMIQHKTRTRNKGKNNSAVSAFCHGERSTCHYKTSSLQEEVNTIKSTQIQLQDHLKTNFCSSQMKDLSREFALDILVKLEDILPSN